VESPEIMAMCNVQGGQFMRLCSVRRVSCFTIAQREVRRVRGVTSHLQVGFREDVCCEAYRVASVGELGNACVQ
jgi:hypothetical protein